MDFLVLLLLGPLAKDDAEEGKEEEEEEEEDEDEEEVDIVDDRRRGLQAGLAERPSSILSTVRSP